MALLFPKTLEYPTGPSASEEQTKEYVEILVEDTLGVGLPNILPAEGIGQKPGFLSIWAYLWDCVDFLISWQLDSISQCSKKKNTNEILPVF